jgi:FixJ family two-component response regulator
MPDLVHVVDDDAPFRTAIERRLKNAGYEVETYLSAQHLLDRLPGVDKPACILLDVQMPGLGGLELQDRLVELGSILPIIFITGHSDIPTSVRAIKHGAEDFLTKPISSGQLLDAINRAVARYDLVRSQRTELNAFLALVATLTPRERQVFYLMTRGMINKSIARELGTTERTVKAHRHEVMEKLQAESLAELVSSAVRLGVLPRLPLLPPASAGLHKTTKVDF